MHRTDHLDLIVHTESNLREEINKLMIAAVFLPSVIEEIILDYAAMSEFKNRLDSKSNSFIRSINGGIILMLSVSCEYNYNRRVCPGGCITRKPHLDFNLMLFNKNALIASALTAVPIRLILSQIYSQHSELKLSITEITLGFKRFCIQKSPWPLVKSMIREFFASLYWSSKVWRKIRKLESY